MLDLANLCRRATAFEGAINTTFGFGFVEVVRTTFLGDVGTNMSEFFAYWANENIPLLVMAKILWPNLIRDRLRFFFPCG